MTAPLPLSDDHPDELLSRTITPPTKTQELSIEEIYEIERTVQLLNDGGFRLIALQFPDDLLHDAAEVSRRLQLGVEGAKMYILADTSYGRYCYFLGKVLRVVVALTRLRRSISMRMLWCIMDGLVFRRMDLVCVCMCDLIY